MAKRPSKPKEAPALAALGDWIGATVASGESYTSRYHQRYDWHQSLVLAQGVALTLARLNAKVCASQTLRLYTAGKSSSVETRGVGRKTKRYLASGRAGHKAAEWATTGGDAEEVVDHPVLDLLNRPSPWHTGRQVTELRFVYRQIVGNAFDLIVRDPAARNGPVMALVPMDPRWVTVQADNEQFIRAYYYDRSRTDGVELSPDDVLHTIWARSESDPYVGEGWFHNVRAEAKMLATDAGFSIAFAERGYQPPFALQFDDGFVEDSAKKTMQYLRATFAGWAKMVNPLLVWRGKYVPTQTVPKDLQSNEKIRECRLAILAAAGVPESMYALNDANLASAQQGYSVQYLDATIRPAINSDAEQLTEFLLPHFGVMPGEMWFAYDNPVPENEAADADRMLREVAAGVRTKDEYRAEFGMTPLVIDAPPIRSDFPVLDATGEAGQLPESPESGTGSGSGTRLGEGAVIRLSFDPASVKAVGWWGGPCPCCEGRSHKAADLPSAMEAAFAEWYERMIRDHSRDIALGRSVSIPDGELEALFRRFLPDLLRDAATSEATRLNVTASDFTGDVTRAIEEYLPTLSAQVRQTTQERVAEIQRVVADTLREGVNDGASIDQIAEEVASLAPEEAGYLAERVARTETAYASTRGSMLAWARAEITEKEWLLAPGGCPVCSEMASTRSRVKAQDAFARAGETFGGYTLGRDAYGPPLHPNCRCAMMPVVEGSTDA